jgi:hypothetical protein
MADDFAKADRPPARHPGRRAVLSRGEVIALAVFGQWRRFAHEADVSRDAARRRRAACPGLPSRCQLNRPVRRHRAAIARFALWLAARLGAPDATDEVLAGTGVRTRTAKRRGHGWLCGQADLGCCTRRGCSHGAHLLTAVPPAGVITGFGCGPAATNDRVLAEPCFARRAAPDPRLPSAGAPAGSGAAAADMGFGGRECEARWAAASGAHVTCPPPPDRQTRRWPRALRRWLASIRQVVETVPDRLLDTVGLARERPQDLRGRQARRAAKAARHNACVGLNRQVGAAGLAIAEVLAWD